MDVKNNMTFLKAQRNEIEKHKWIMSEKAGKDLGYWAELDWVLKYRSEYRRRWNDQFKKPESA